MYPNLHHKRIFRCGLYIEMKIKPNGLSKSQREFKDLGENYFDFEVHYSAEEAFNAIAEHLNIGIRV